MLELLNVNISTEEIKEMLEENPELEYLSNSEVINLIDLLRSVGCSDKIIRNIITTNPIYLNRIFDSVLELIQKLKLLGIKRLDITFDSNPLLLNEDADDIDEFILEKRKNGMEIDDIIGLISMGVID